MTVSATSITSYHQLMREGGLSKKCCELVAGYQAHGVLGDFELAPLIAWHPSQVSARRGDLMVKDNEGHDTGTGLIIEYGTVYNPATRREVNRYKLNIGQQPSLL